jgi:hypothetical protein
MVADEVGESLAPAREDDALADHLAVARDAASIAFSAEGRSRQALYRAIGLAHAFALLAQARRTDYQELLSDAGLIENERNPLATLVRLVFGCDYDKTRMSEFARVIGRAVAEGVAPGALAPLLARTQGGLKAYLAQARAAARGHAAPAQNRALARARKRLAAAEPLAADALTYDDAALAVAVVRRCADGSVALLGGLAPDEPLSQRVLQSIARTS